MATIRDTHGKSGNDGTSVTLERWAVDLYKPLMDFTTNGVLNCDCKGGYSQGGNARGRGWANWFTTAPSHYWLH